MQAQTLSQSIQKCEEDTIKCLDSRYKEKYPLSDSTLINKWSSLWQFDHNAAVQFLDTCHVQKVSLQKKECLNNNRSTTMSDREMLQ
jgi:hypothetical protein